MFLDVIGGGQLAKAFKPEQDDEVVIFASGVSNSTCTDKSEFLREEKLLKLYLDKSSGKKFVYFSSCALSAGEGYPKSPYYQHKAAMEELILQYTDKAYIFRIPQLFGCFISHNTIINFFYQSVLSGASFKVYDDAYRYLIQLDDVKKLVLSYLEFSEPTRVDIANPYRYRVLDIVETLETALGKKANYELVNQSDKYLLDLTSMENFINSHNLDLNFGKDYFEKKLVIYLNK